VLSLKDSVQDVETPNCPTHKRSKMVYKNGRFGPFWGCSKYPKCKETINISNSDIQKRIFLKLTSYKDITNFYMMKDSQVIEGFFQSELYHYLLEQLNFSGTSDYYKTIIRRAIEVIKTEAIIESIHITETSALISWLRNKNKYFYVAAFIYFLYRINKKKLGPNWLDSSWDFWLSPRLSTDLNFQEWNIREAIKNDYKQCFFKSLGIVVSDFECKSQYGRADIIGSDKHEDNIKVIIELKTKKHRTGINQVLNYRDDYIRNFGIGVKCYVIGTGYPAQYIDHLIQDGNKEYIGLISYLVQNDEILFIPWKEAKRFN
jgi:Topoisomerase DNA binding C4 zinc finger